MMFEFKIWVKSKLIDTYYVRRFAVDVLFEPIHFIQSHIISNGKEDVKCTLVEFSDGSKKIAVDQYTSFLNQYEAFIEAHKEKDLPSAN